MPLQTNPSKDLTDPATYSKFLGKEQYYHDFMTFFQSEMSQKGWQNVVKEWVLANDDKANDMLIRMHAGFLHPLIHLGFGIEFGQPAIVAEALAQAAVHSTWIGPLFLAAEKKADEAKSKDALGGRSLFAILEDIRKDDVMLNATQQSDSNKLRDGVLARAKDKMVDYTSQYYLPPDADLQLKTAEHINLCAYYTLCSQRPNKLPKVDFFYMHDLNCSIFFSSFLDQDWLSREDRVRLLEWKGRMDLASYVSRHNPQLDTRYLTEYKPKKPGDWTSVIERVTKFPDDGHTAKLIRALANGHDKCARYEDKSEAKAWMIKGDMWLQGAHMVLDSVEEGDTHWVRSTGFDSAWEKVKNRDDLDRTLYPEGQNGRRDGMYETHL